MNGAWGFGVDVTAVDSVSRTRTVNTRQKLHLPWKAPRNAKLGDKIA